MSRRRASGPQPVQPVSEDAVHASQGSSFDPDDYMLEGVQCETSFDKASHNRAYHYLMQYLTVDPQFVEYCRQKKLAVGHKAARRTACRRYWFAQEQKDKMTILKAAICLATDDCADPLVVQGLSTMHATLASKAPGVLIRKRVRGRNCMLTYNGQWGVVPQSLQPEALQRGGLPLFSDRQSVHPSVPFRALLRGHEFVLNIWRALQAHVSFLVENLKLATWSVSLEVCPLSLAAHECRLHAHVFLSGGGLVELNAHALKFLSSVPHINGEEYPNSGARGRMSRLAVYAGHYYLAIEKSSQIFSLSSLVPHRSYVVRPEWIMIFFCRNLITGDTAVVEIVRAKRDVARYISNIQTQQQHEEAILVQELKRKARDELAALARPCKRIKAVDDLFLCQFARPMLRRKFLVLDGRSGLGKTEYVKQLRIPGKEQQGVLELTCQGNTMPNLSKFSPLEHSVLFFDECSPLLVASHRKLFQGVDCEIELGASTTGMFRYYVWTHATAIVIASNRFKRDVNKLLDKSDQQWIFDNCVYVSVKSALWVR